MFLDQILAACGFPAVAGDVEITGITSDSRKVEKGFLFAALPVPKRTERIFYRTLMKKGPLPPSFRKRPSFRICR